MAILLTETGNRLVQETGFAVLVEVPVIPPLWTDLNGGVPKPWQTHVPPSPILWTTVNPAGYPPSGAWSEDWTEITPA